MRRRRSSVSPSPHLSCWRSSPALASCRSFMPDSEIRGLHHVGFVVPRIAPALARWTDEGAVVLVEPIDDPIQRVTVALVQAPGELPVELVAPTPGRES